MTLCGITVHGDYHGTTVYSVGQPGQHEISCKQIGTSTQIEKLTLQVPVSLCKNENCMNRLNKKTFPS